MKKTFYQDVLEFSNHSKVEIGSQYKYPHRDGLYHLIWILIVKIDNIEKRWSFSTPFKSHKRDDISCILNEPNSLYKDRVVEMYKLQILRFICNNLFKDDEDYKKRIENLYMEIGRRSINEEIKDLESFKKDYDERFIEIYESLTLWQLEQT